MSEKRTRISLAKKLDIIGYMAILYGFEPAQMKPALNLSQVDEWPEDISELDKCFYEPASIIVTPGKRKRI